MAVTVGTVRYAPGHEYAENEQWRVFVCCISWYTIPDEEPSQRGPRTEKVGCWRSWANKDVGCDSKTPGYASSKPHGEMPSLPNGTLKNLQTQWRRKGTGTPPPDRSRQPTPEPTPPLPETQPALTGNNGGPQLSQIVNLPAGYAYSHTSLPCAESFTLDVSAQDSQHDTDIDPDMLTDEGISTG